MIQASKRPQRHSIRLQDFDYTQAGAYFVTICAYQRQCFFGAIADDGNMILNTIGCIVTEEWEHTAVIRPYVTLDEFIVMPNHLHGIIQISDDARVCRRQTPTNQFAATNSKMSIKAQYGKPLSKSLSSILLQFKSVTTKRINKMLNTTDTRIWQRNYYEHIIRDETALNRIREYIVNNPSNWVNDSENPSKNYP